MRKNERPNFPCMEQLAKRPHIPLQCTVLKSVDMQAAWYQFSQLPQNRPFDAGLLFISPHVNNTALSFSHWFPLNYIDVGNFLFTIVVAHSEDLTYALFIFFQMQQSYVSSGHQMAPPSPNTNSSSNSSGGGGEQLSKTNLYIRGLHPGTTDQDLVKLCQPWVILDLSSTIFVSDICATRRQRNQHFSHLQIEYLCQRWSADCLSTLE